MRRAGGVQPISFEEIQSIQREVAPRVEAQRQQAEAARRAYEAHLAAMNPIGRYLNTGVKTELERVTTGLAAFGLAVLAVGLGSWLLGPPLILAAVAGARKLQLSDAGILPIA